MTRQPNERDRYVAKVNALIASGRDDLIEEIVRQYREPSGRDAFWSAVEPGWPGSRRR